MSIHLGREIHCIFSCFSRLTLEFRIRRKRNTGWKAGYVLFWAILVESSALGQLNHEREPINYSKTAGRDRVAKLQSDLDSGAVRLQWQNDFGYLQSLLLALKISPSSQVLVFSKTSFQSNKISPGNPRAIYFADDVYVGWVPGGEFIEIAAIDSQLGAVFYAIKQRSDEAEITREIGRCMTCHASTHTRRVPGLIVRSVYCDASGEPQLRLGSFVTGDSSPLHERWGGWYVTGTHGSLRHLGNSVIKATFDSEGSRDSESSPQSLETKLFDSEAGANRTSLQGLTDSSKYLSPHSDIVALMVLEHQTQMHNAITAACHLGRLTARDSQSLNALLERPLQFESEEIDRRYTHAAESLVRALFMTEAVSWDAQQIEGTSTFAAEFQSMGPQDEHGRSLRDLELKTRLFRFPCSYLVYSDAFRQLPAGIRLRVQKRMLDVLKGQRQSEFPALNETVRQQLHEILVATGALE